MVPTSITVNSMKDDEFSSSQWKVQKTVEAQNWMTKVRKLLNLNFYVFVEQTIAREERQRVGVKSSAQQLVANERRAATASDDFV